MTEKYIMMEPHPSDIKAGKDSKQVSATVNFVITIPHKMSLISTDKKTSFNSNTNNLLITNQKTNSHLFISQTKPIKLQQTSQGSYTIATP
uniref:Uncharacterized protein n=1 Tax=uncultured Thiotrichaceae bacterium TaxID=298394 RepID=A0A6S6UP96_9GAMM|nr:MAG: Unknown protein [uncultured Thiotrichaceae bacterium]